jgi:hypothetical protein
MNKKERKKENFAVHLKKKKENKRIDFFPFFLVWKKISHTHAHSIIAKTHTRG